MVPVCFIFRWEFMKFSSDITFVCSSQLYLRHPAPGKAASRSSAESAARHVTSYTFGLFSTKASAHGKPARRSSAESAARHHYGSHKFALFSILKPQSIFSTGIYFRGGTVGWELIFFFTQVRVLFADGLKVHDQ
jgi:hypothetical protein